MADDGNSGHFVTGKRAPGPAFTMPLRDLP
jgi:hypothetical protein